MTKKKINRREFLKQSAAASTLVMGVPLINPAFASQSKKGSLKKVIVIGIDGMDPRLTEKMMAQGRLPNFYKLQQAGGYRRLGTSTPPQSPVAWGNFINGAGPGSHGIFDFVHRNPERQYAPFFSAAETLPGIGGLEIGEYKLQLPFWPFNHQPPETVLRRKGIPFWDYLDKEGIPSVFYDLPSNYPPSESKYSHHKCLSGMGTPDVLGSYGTYQHFAEDGPIQTKNESGGKRSRLVFKNDTAAAKIVGPRNDFLIKPEETAIDFLIHRDLSSKSAAIDIQGKRILLKEGEWSEWIKLDFEMTTPEFMPSEHVSGICRLYLQEAGPNFRFYVSPVNIDPSNPAVKISEPDQFVKTISQRLGLFYTLGFQETHKALSNKIFTDDEFAIQAENVLKERLRLLDYALDNYHEGLLFFYFSSTDLQSHMFWWDSDENHPVRSSEEAKKRFEHIQDIYAEMDRTLGRLLKRWGDEATIMVLSDHGFANFQRQFGLNTWLRDNGYIQQSDCRSLLSDVDWHGTRAYGLGINGLYINTAGRERDGIVDSGSERQMLLRELTERLESVRDVDGRKVINKVYDSDDVYKGDKTSLAPDLIVGYKRGYRASWATCLGGMEEQVLSDNHSAWSADHCSDPAEVPGVLFMNRPVKAVAPALIDLAPTILSEFGLSKPKTMEGNNIL